ncbi:hypothetical protein GC163_19970 [bacterium]|nr:hypothetical protein [bacterium]
MTRSEIAQQERETAEALGLDDAGTMLVTQDTIRASEKYNLPPQPTRRDRVPVDVCEWTFLQAREWLRRTRSLHAATREASYQTACEIWYYASDSQKMALLADAQCSMVQGVPGLLHLERVDQNSAKFTQRARFDDAARVMAAHVLAKRANEAANRGEQFRGDLFALPDISMGTEYDTSDSPIERGARFVS